MSVVRICNLTDHWFPDKIGGSCLYAFKLHQLLSKHVQVESVTLVGDPAACESDMVVHKVLHKAGILRNRKAIRQLDQDSTVWIVHSPWFFLHLFVALGFKARNRVVGVYHGPWYREYFASASARKFLPARLIFGFPRYLIELFYAFYVKRFIFLSETMYRATSQFLPVSKSKAAIIPMWSDKDDWDHPTPKRDPLILSTFRRLEPRMGLQDLIKALKRCDLGNYKLIICGDGPYRRDLEELVEELELQDNVQLMGWVTEEDKLQWLKESDAVVIPSRSLEGFSLLALESLENGTPVCLTDQVGFYEYVRDIEQDFVKKIDLHAPKVEIQAFLSKGLNRSGLDRLQAAFSVERIGTELREVILGND